MALHGHNASVPTLATTSTAASCPCRHPVHSWDTPCQLPFCSHRHRRRRPVDRRRYLDHREISPRDAGEWQGSHAPVFLWEEDEGWRLRSRSRRRTPRLALSPGWIQPSYTGWNYPQDRGTSHTQSRRHVGRRHWPLSHCRRHREAARDAAQECQRPTCHHRVCRYAYDHRQAVRDYWRDNCLAIANAGLDGCGADFGRRAEFDGAQHGE